jgi:hypothetical protein
VEQDLEIAAGGAPVAVVVQEAHADGQSTTATARASGASTSVLRAAPFNFGVTIGAFVVLEANVSFGFKKEYNHEKE